MKNIYGDLSGISKKRIKELEAIYDHNVPSNQIGDEHLCSELLRLSTTMNKEVAVYLNRSGQVSLVAVGKKSSASIPEMTEKRSAEGLKKLGCIHTHPSGNPILSREDLQSLENYSLDYMCALAENQKSVRASVAFLRPVSDFQNTEPLEIYQDISLEDLFALSYSEIIKDLEKSFSGTSLFVTGSDKEKAILFIPHANKSEEELYEQTEEFKNLAESAGLQIVETITQNIKQSRAIIGKGKIEDLRLLIAKTNPDCVLIDAVISPSQEKNLTENLMLKIIDRTNLILDIFAQRAKSNEGKLQVELAQLQYLLPRIMGQGIELSRLGGGVGTRGPGETQLETDRRHIRRRIDTLEKQLQTVKKRRTIQKQNRIKKELPLISLVGYTNSGKSSLLNALTDDQIFAEDLLFATLDTTTRAVTFKESGNTALLTDTVGFISNLPHQLVSAFKSTLEEVLEADLLLHVIDISNSNWQQHLSVVEHLFSEMGALDKDMLYVFNKIDLIDPADVPITTDKPYVFTSVKTGEGLSALLQKIEDHFYRKITIAILVPYSKQKLIAMAHEQAEVKEKKHLENGTFMRIHIDQKKTDLFKDYIIPHEQA